MNNKRKYKTLKLLVIAVLLAIFFVFARGYAMKLLNKKNADDIITNMLIIQGKVQVINGKIKVNSEENSYIGTKISEIENNEIKEKIKQLGFQDNEFENLYLLNTDDYGRMGISEELKRPENEVYVVNYKQVDVIYLKGVYTDNTTKYKLSDIMKKMEQPKWILYNSIKNNE